MHAATTYSEHAGLQSGLHPRGEHSLQRLAWHTVEMLPMVTVTRWRLWGASDDPYMVHYHRKRTKLLQSRKQNTSRTYSHFFDSGRFSNLPRVTQQSGILILGLLMSYLVLSPQAHEAPQVKISARVTGHMLPHQPQVGSYIQM